MKLRQTLLDEYRFPGCRPRAYLKGVFGDPSARVVTLVRTQKKVAAANAGGSIAATTTNERDASGTSPAGTPGSTWRWRFAGCGAGRAAR